MKGTVVATWIQTAKKLWGEDVVAAVMEQNGWPAGRKITAPSDNIVLNKLYRNAFALDEILQHLSRLVFLAADGRCADKLFEQVDELGGKR